MLQTNIDLNTKTALLTRIETSLTARVRIYARAADQGPDGPRAIGTDPTDYDGVILEVVTTPGQLAWDLSPMVVAMNMDDDDTFPITISNLSGAPAADIIVTLTFLPLES